MTHDAHNSNSGLEGAIAYIEQQRDAGVYPFADLPPEFSEYQTELEDFIQATADLDRLCRPIRQAALATTEPPDIEGYDDLVEIDRGGMGIVYQATQNSTQRKVAIKVIRPERLVGLSHKQKDAVLERFRIEPIATLDHPNIVRVYHTGSIDGDPYFVMEFVSGVTLRELLQDLACTVWELVNFVEQAARGIQYAHRHGVLHRDIKPANILIDLQTRTAKIADFGLAKIQHHAELGADDSKQSPVVLGTLAYMSPEQRHDSDDVTVASDIYSLGATLFLALTGELPRNPNDIGSAFDAADRPQEKPQIPHRLQAICQRCLSESPNDRFGSAEELADELAQLRGEPGSYTAPLFSNMAWPLILFGGFHVAAQAGVMAIARYWPSEPAIWALFFSMYVPLFAMFWLTKLPERMQSIAARRELWSIWLGHLLAVATTVTCLRVQTADFSETLPLAYAVLATSTGLALFAMAANFWRGHYVLGAGWMAFALAIAAWPAWAVMIFAVGAACCSAVIGLYELHLFRDRWLDQPLPTARRQSPTLASPLSLLAHASELSQSSTQSRQP